MAAGVTKKRGLGKGLDALLGPSAASDLAAIDEGDELRLLPVDLLQRSPFQPRTDFDAASLKELADSIRAQGIVQPVLVRPTPKQDRFEIIAGERRWRAAQLAGLHEVPALVRKIDDRAAMCLSLIENIQREDLNPLDQARALSRLLEEFDMTHDAVAEAVGRSRSTVTNLLRLLELDPQVRKLVEARQLEMGHARALLALPKPSQLAAAKVVVGMWVLLG
jgi:ParB family chromosome partitioning protein